MLRITDIQDNSVVWSEVPYCEIEEEKLEKYLLKKNDLVFARTGATVGKSFLIRSEPPKAVYASYLKETLSKEKIVREHGFAPEDEEQYLARLNSELEDLGFNLATDDPDYLDFLRNKYHAKHEENH